MPSFSLTQNNGRACFNVSITDDGIFELTEYFNVSLALDVNATLPDGATFGTTRARVQIADNEGKHIRIHLLSVHCNNGCESAIYSLQRL